MTGLEFDHGGQQARRTADRHGSLYKGRSPGCWTSRPSRFEALVRLLSGLAIVCAAGALVLLVLAQGAFR